MSFITTLPHLRQSMREPPSFIHEAESEECSRISAFRDSMEKDRSRKEVLQEAESMNKRISLLRQQEMRAWKQTQLNNQKAMDIYESKARSQSLSKETQLLKQTQLKAAHEHHLQLLKHKREEDQLKSHQKHRKYIRQKKRKQAEMHEYFQQQRKAISQNKERDESRSRYLYSEGKARQERQKALLQHYQEFKIEKVKLAQQEKQYQEQMEVGVLQERVESMHKIKNQLQHRLSLSQHLKQFSQQKLQDATSLYPQAFRQRYQKFDRQQDQGGTTMPYKAILTEQ